MHELLSSRIDHHMTRLGILLLVTALVAGIAGCPAQLDPEPAPTVRYDLTVSSSEGGSVTSPGEGTLTYHEGESVLLVAEPDEGYRFVDWTGDVDTIANINAARTTIGMAGDYAITGNFEAIPPAQYTLTISSTAGGSVTTPGEGPFTYEEGTMVDLVAEAEEGYVFIGWTGDVTGVVDIDAASTSIAAGGHHFVAANFAKGIYSWYDLDAVKDNLSGSYVLMNDLGSTAPGYAELAGPAANGGRGWEPIGSLAVDPFYFGTVDCVPFVGVFDGQGYEVSDLSVRRPDEGGMGLFGLIGERGTVRNLGLRNAEVVGCGWAGSIAGHNSGTLSNSYSDAIVRGDGYVGGLVGGNSGTLSYSSSGGTVTGEWGVGGLVGINSGTVLNSRSTGSVSSAANAGGLVGWQHHGSVENSHFGGSVTGTIVGGLVAESKDGSVRNSYYNYDRVIMNGSTMITIGALRESDFDQWLANDKFLDVNERLSQQGGYYLIDSITDFRQLLAFGQDGSLRFRLRSDLDMGSEPSFYIPYLAGEFDGNGHKVSNLSFSSGSVSQVGLFGYVISGAKISQLSLENVNLTGHSFVGGLVGRNEGTISSSSYSRGTLAGKDRIGGLVGENDGGTVDNSHYDYDEVTINGRHMVTPGALSGGDFDEWLTNGRFLDINQRLSLENDYYLIKDVADLRSLLAFAHDGSLKFRLERDLDLATTPSFYIPYLAGEFDGNGHLITNLTFDSDWTSNVGLFGHIASGGSVSHVRLENVNIAGHSNVGAFVGHNAGTVSDCYSTGSVTGHAGVGGLVGENTRDGAVSNSCFTGSVSGGTTIGGLVGWNHGAVSNSCSVGSVIGTGGVGGVVGSNGGSVINSYSSGAVTGEWGVGGLVGYNDGTVEHSYATAIVIGSGAVGGLVGWREGTIGDCFWDMDASGQATSAGGTGKTTAEMQSIATFSGAGWSIVAIPGADTRNTSYVWNIIDGEDYPFLSWEPVT